MRCGRSPCSASGPGLWSDGRRAEIADQASVLSGATGAAGVNRLMAMAHWVQEKRGSDDGGGLRAQKRGALGGV